MSASKPTPVVPTLHSMSTPKLEKPADVATYLIGWLFRNPGGTSSVNEGEMISYRKLISMYGSDPNELSSRISNMLERSLNHYFPNANYTVSCEVEDIEGYDKEDGTYQGNKGITIAVRDEAQVCIVPITNITVNEDGSEFDISFTGGKDSL